MFYIITLAIAAGLGLIPANIAKGKGYSFGLWWFYGWMLFIVAIIHVSLIPDKTASNVRNNSILTTSNAEELAKYKNLLDAGVITQAEFEIKKQQLLGL